MPRKAKEFDRVKFEECLKIQMTKPEVCGVLGLSHCTLDKNIKEAYKDEFENPNFSSCMERYGAEGKASLRRVAWQKAINGNEKILLRHMEHHLGMHKENNVKMDTKVEIVLSEDLDKWAK